MGATRDTTQRLLAPLRTLRRSFELPPAEQREAARRLGSLAALLGALFAVATVLRHVAAAGDLVKSPLWHGVPVWDVATLAWALLSVGLYFYSRRAAPGRVLLVGLLYEVLLCLDLATLESMSFDFGTWPVRLSFIILPLVTFPLVVPAALPKRLLTTLLGLAMLPVGLVLGRTLAGEDMLPLANYLLLAPTFVAALAAFGASRLVHRLNQRVSEAQELGSYELVERLGGGGMGEVWRARHRLLVRPAAIKVIRPEALGQDAASAIARFEREAQATSVLRSPHTVQVYDFGRTADGAFYYAMELLDGLDLDELVREYGPVPPGRAVHILRQLLDSLAEAHSHGLVHRDIKPSNVFLARLGLAHDFVKVLDFGLVKAGEDPEEPAISNPAAASGTPAYLAPELAVGGAIDGRTDLYGVGCVAFWLLTGDLVFPRDSRLETAIAHVRDVPEPPSARSETPIPRALDDLVLRCLAKAPEDRPATATALGTAFDELGLPWTAAQAGRWWDVHMAPAPVSRVLSLRPPARSEGSDEGHDPPGEEGAGRRAAARAR